jgi:hypothetical protein
MASKPVVSTGKNVRMNLRMGQIRVQVDRWPLTADESNPYVLTIIIGGMYRSKPGVDEIKKALADAVEIIESGPQ